MCDLIRQVTLRRSVMGFFMKSYAPPLRLLLQHQKPGISFRQAFVRLTQPTHLNLLWRHLCYDDNLCWLDTSRFWVEVKSSTCYSASYMRRTQDQKRFTILEVAADWHELMIPQRTMRPSIARVNEHLDPRFAASRHTTAPISHTRPSPRSP